MTINRDSVVDFSGTFSYWITCAVCGEGATHAYVEGETSATGAIVEAKGFYCDKHNPIGLAAIRPIDPTWIDPAEWVLPKG